MFFHVFTSTKQYQAFTKQFQAFFTEEENISIIRSSLEVCLGFSLMTLTLRKNTRTPKLLCSWLSSSRSSSLRPCYFFVTLFFYRCLRFTAKLRRKHKRPPVLPPSHTHTASLIINITHPRGTLVTIDALHGHVKITRSPQFTLGFTLGGVQSAGLDRCIIICVDM